MIHRNYHHRSTPQTTALQPPSSPPAPSTVFIIFIGITIIFYISLLEKSSPPALMAALPSARRSNPRRKRVGCRSSERTTGSRRLQSFVGRRHWTERVFGLGFCHVKKNEVFVFVCLSVIERQRERE
ncbi:hypothetical protein Hanom_Chr09g00764651 [Helianthus anomalus]